MFNFLAHPLSTKDFFESGALSHRCVGRLFHSAYPIPKSGPHRGPLFFGSSRNTREGSADFEEEVLLIAIAVSAPLDDLDGVIDAFDDAGVQRVPAPGHNAMPVAAQAMGELL